MPSIKTETRTYELLINGKLTAPAGKKYSNSLNPSTGEVLARVADADCDDIDRTVMAARQTFEGAKNSLRERAQALLAIANLIREHAKELAELESQDVGKTLKQTTFIDVPTCADTFEYF